MCLAAPGEALAEHLSACPTSVVGTAAPCVQAMHGVLQGGRGFSGWAIITCLVDQTNWNAVTWSHGEAWHLGW